MTIPHAGVSSLPPPFELRRGKQRACKKSMHSCLRSPHPRNARAETLHVLGFRSFTYDLELKTKNSFQPKAKIFSCAGSRFEERNQRGGMVTTVQVPGLAASTALAISCILGRTKLHLFLLR